VVKIKTRKFQNKSFFRAIIQYPNYIADEITILTEAKLLPSPTTGPNKNPISYMFTINSYPPDIITIDYKILS